MKENWGPQRQGVGRPKGTKLSEEEIALRTETRRKNGWLKDPQVFSEKIRSANTGQKRSAESREKMRLSKLGNENRLGGKKYTEQS